MKKETASPKGRTEKIEVWKCKDLKAMIKKTIQKELEGHGVKDAKLAKRLEEAISGGIAYGTGGGGGGVGVA